MGLFGWSMPPGCSGTPYDETGAEDITALVVAIAPLPAGVDAVYWDEDGNVIEGYHYTVPADPDAGIPEYTEGANRTALTVDWEWLEDGSDECAHNAAKAAREYVLHTRRGPDEAAHFRGE